MSVWRIFMDWLSSNLLVNLVVTVFLSWALSELLDLKEYILEGIAFKEDDNWEEEGVHNIEEVLHEEFEEEGIGDEVDQAEEVEVESEYEENVHDLEESGENCLREGRENIREDSDGNNLMSEERSDCEDHGSELEFSSAVSLPVAIVSPLTTVVDFRNVLAGALRGAASELRVSARETEHIMKRLHKVECHTHLREERELGLQEHHWSSCKLYLKHDLVNKYVLAVRDRISLPRRV